MNYEKERGVGVFRRLCDFRVKGPTIVVDAGPSPLRGRRGTARTVPG